jgi:predicted nucleic acid-binding Zn ribbon protein
MKTPAYKRGSYAKSLKPCEVCGTMKEMTANGKYCSNACKMRARNNKKKVK